MDESDGDSVHRVRYRKNSFGKYGYAKNSGKSSQFHYSSSVISSSYSQSVSLSDEEPESNSTESTSDIFYIYKPYPEKRYELDRKLGSPTPGTYRKHAALDTQQLSVGQRLRLVGLHYLRPSNILRIIFVLACFGWFMFNAITVFEEFLDFDTIVYMEYRSPDITSPPAITICTYCIYCGYNQSNKMIVEPFVEDETNNKGHYPIHLGDDFLNVSQYNLELKDIVDECVLESSTVPQDKSAHKIACDQVAPVVVSMEEGHKCFTYFSDVRGGVNQSKVKDFQMEFERFPKISLTFSAKHLNSKPKWNKEQFEMKEKIEDENSAGIYLVLHSPGILPDMLGLTLRRVKPGKAVSVRFTKMIEDLKEPPYKTGCFPYPLSENQSPTESDPYVLESKKKLPPTSGLSIYRSQGECFLYCMWRVLGHAQPCVNFYNIFTEEQLFNEQMQRQKWHLLEQKRKLEQGLKNFSIWIDKPKPIVFCNKTTNGYSDYVKVRADCINTCRPACHKETFSIGNVMEMTYDESPNMDSIYTIEWSTDPVIYIEHREKFTTPGFLGNIGGHAHIWLGISVIHIFRWLVKAIRSGRFLHQPGFCWIFSWCARNEPSR